MVLYIIYIYELVWYSKLGECIIYLKYISFRNQDVDEKKLTATASRFVPAAFKIVPTHHCNMQKHREFDMTTQQKVEVRKTDVIIIRL